MYELTVERQFSAAHHLPGYPGVCARLHGHNYRVLVTLRGEELDERGFLADFSAVKAVCDEVLEELDHHYLNDLPGLAGGPPTAERLARYLFGRIREAAQGLGPQLYAVKVYEAPTSAVTYREE